MVSVRRKDFKEIRLKNGKVIPKCYECRYYSDGKEIAWYTSKDDTIFLRTDYIGTDFSKSEYERALTCSMKEAYKYLFDMLGADEKTKMSEYLNGI